METGDIAMRVETLEGKVDALSASVDRRFDEVDRRFDAVDAAFAEQRRYTEFAFGQLSARIEQTNGGLSRIERKLDQFIDTHLRRES